MAGKISTLILTVDLDCYICSKKIRKTICKLQGREQIQTVTFDEKNNTVTISGLFDPQKLKKKLLCKACKVIKDIKIKEEEKKPPPPKEPEKPKPAQPDKPKEPAKPEQEKPKQPEKPKEPEKPKQPEKPKEPEKPKQPEKPKEPAKPKEPEKPKETPKQPEPEKEKPKPQPAQPAWPIGAPLPTCCWRPCYEQYYGGCRCCSCGMFFGWTAPPLPPAGGWMGGPCTSSSTCQFFCEEDPSCTIM